MFIVFVRKQKYPLHMDGNKLIIEK